MPAPTVRFGFHHQPTASSMVRREIGDIAGASPDAVLIASELVTNVFLHTGDGGTIRYWSNLDGRQRIEVEDDDPRPPIRTATVSELGGMGMLIVDKVCRQWGVELVNAGKVIWVELDVPNGPASRSASAQT